MDLKKIVESLCRERNTFGTARATTMTITDQDNRRIHLYVNYVMPWEVTVTERGEFYEVPFSVITRVNGKGRNNHFIYVVIDATNGEYYAWNLNKPHQIEFLLGRKVGLGLRNADLKGVEETENNEPLPF